MIFMRIAFNKIYFKLFQEIIYIYIYIKEIHYYLL